MAGDLAFIEPENARLGLISKRLELNRRLVQFVAEVRPDRKAKLDDRSIVGFAMNGEYVEGIAVSSPEGTESFRKHGDEP